MAIGYFQILRKSLSELDVRYPKMMGLEMLFLFVTSISSYAAFLGLNIQLSSFKVFTREEFLANPSLLATIDINPWAIFWKSVGIVTAFIAIQLLCYSIIKAYEYNVALGQRIDHLATKRFIWFNLLWWIASWFIMGFLSLIIIYSYMMFQMFGAFSTLNAILVLGSFLVFLVVWYIKMIANIHFFINDNSVKNSLKTALHAHYFIPYMIVLEVIWLMIYAIIKLLPYWVILAVFLLLYLFLTSSTRIFFIDVVRKINGK